MSTITTAEQLREKFVTAIYAAAHGVTPEQVEPGDRGLEEVGRLVTAAIATGIKHEHENGAPQEAQFRHIVFAGDFEEFHSMNDAKERLEELLDAGHCAPTLVNAALDRPGGDVLALRAVKHITTATSGEIR